MTADGRRLRVLHVGKFFPPHMGGIETHLHALTTELQSRVDVRVIVASDDKKTHDEVVDGVPVTRVGTTFTLAGAPITPGMAARIYAADADIVHVHLPHPTAVLAYLGSRHKGRLVTTYHSDIVRQRVLGAAFGPFLAAFLRKSSAIVATSPNYAASSPILPAYADRLHVIPYGIPIAQFERRDPAAESAIRQRYGDRLLVSVGRLIYYKGFEYLVDAMQHVRGRVLIVGDGPLRRSLEERARERGVTDKVVFIGEVQNRDTPPYYHASDAFVLASIARSEAFGIVQLEAMACGRPVVNTRLNSGVEFVSLDGVTGLTVPPADPIALAAALNRILDDGALRARFGEAARARVREEFSQPLMVERMIALYERVMAAPAR